MTSLLSRRVREIFESLADLPADERERALAAMSTREDAQTIARTRALLAELDTPPEVVVTGAALRDAVDALRDPVLTAGFAGVRLGKYRLGRLIDQGGMGAVYEAEQDDPRRTVAVKVMRFASATPELLRRFRHETQILGSLQHPCIAQIYEAGTYQFTPTASLAGLDGGVRPYFAMEYVRGARAITRYAQEVGLDLRARLELFARVCDGVQHAHQRGVIHRDLKPGNILISDAGEPKIIDFGVARASGSDLTAATMHTTAGQLLGTLRYMSPEQFESGDGVDTRSDVYALGAILYELTTGRCPLDLERVPLARVGEVVRDVLPERPSSIEPRARGDLEAIVLHAIEKAPGARYQSAADLAADVRAFLAGEPIRAHSRHTLYQLRVFARRNRVLVAGSMGALLALVVGLIATSTQLVRARRAERETASARDLAQRRGDLAEQVAYRASIAAAQAALASGDGGAARSRLEDAPPALRGWEWGHLSARADTSRTIVPLEHEVRNLEASRDGRVVVLTDDSGFSRATEVDSLRVLWECHDDPPMYVTQVSPDGTEVLFVGHAGVRVRDVRTGEVRRAFTIAHEPEQLMTGAYSPDGSRLAVIPVRDGLVRVLDARTGAQVWSRPIRQALWSWWVRWSPDGSLLAINHHPDVAILDARTGDEIARWDIAQGQTPQQSGACFSPDSRSIAIAFGPDMRVHEVPTGRILRELHGHTQRIVSLRFDARGERVLTASLDKTARIWSLAGREIPTLLVGHGGTLLNAAWLGDEGVITSSNDGTLRLWDARPAPSVRALPLDVESALCESLAWSADGRSLTSIADGLLTRWHADGARLDSVRTDIAQGVVSAIRPDLGVAIGSDVGGHVVAIDLGDASTRWRSSEAQGKVWRLAITPDGTYALSGTGDGWVQRWDLRDGSPGPRTRVATSPILALEPTPDGSLLVAAEEGGPIHVIELPTLQTRCTIPLDDASTVESIALASDGVTIVACGLDGNIRFFDRRTGRPTRPPLSVGSPLWRGTLSPDGSRFAVGAQDRVVRIYETRAWTELAQLRDEERTCISLAWSPDGTRLAGGTWGGTHVMLWDGAAHAPQTRSLVPLKEPDPAPPR